MNDDLHIEKRRKLPQKYLSKLVRAIIEFSLITAGDRILIGLSGGKDSLFLAFALAALRSIAANRFELEAITIDPLFTPDFKVEQLYKFCAEQMIPLTVRQVNIAAIIAANKGKDACFTCAYFRRGAINKYALESGCNKIALAHHHDDAVETFLMGQLYAGQLKTFLPMMLMERSGLNVIRPLIYFREQELIAAGAFFDLQPLTSTCPMNGKTKRQEVKELIAYLEKRNPDYYTHLAAAMRSADKAELWPQPPTRAQLKNKHNQFWHTLTEF